MDYYNKYLKYKEKYLSLKDILTQSDRIKEKYISLKDILTQSDRIKEKYLSLKDILTQSDNKIDLIGGKRKSKKNKREISNKLEITVLKQGTPSKNVLSVCYFTMKDAYRSVEKYKTNLKFLLISKHQLKDFETRIYTDDSGKDYALEVSKDDPTVSVYHYNYPPLREEIGHIGTFGTFIRFLPLFEKGLEIVYITDIDIPYNYLTPTILDNFIQSKAKFGYRSYVCNEIKAFGRSYSIIANTIISLHTFPKELFDNYLEDLVNPSNELKKDIELLNIENSHKKKVFSKIPYGIDERFLNKNIYNYLVDKNIKCYILKDYIRAEFYLRVQKLLSPEDRELIFIHIYKDTPESFIKLKKVFEEKLPLIKDRYPCIAKDMLQQMKNFKKSFIIPLIKTGKELNENIY